MPASAAEKSERFNMRIPARDKALIARAAALSQKDMSQFILEKAVSEARAVIKDAERIVVSEQDFLRIMELLENPPPLNDKMRAALAALPPLR
jgi:uncharacterized protein (DUF1778 family)